MEVLINRVVGPQFVGLNGLGPLHYMYVSVGRREVRGQNLTQTYLVTIVHANLVNLRVGFLPPLRSMDSVTKTTVESVIKNLYQDLLKRLAA
jgi:hypothetical protein